MFSPRKAIWTLLVCVVALAVSASGAQALPNTKTAPTASPATFGCTEAVFNEIELNWVDPFSPLLLQGSFTRFGWMFAPQVQLRVDTGAEILTIPLDRFDQDRSFGQSTYTFNEYLFELEDSVEVVAVTGEVLNRSGNALCSTEPALVDVDGGGSSGDCVAASASSELVWDVSSGEINVDAAVTITGPPGVAVAADSIAVLVPFEIPGAPIVGFHVEEEVLVPATSISADGTSATWSLDEIFGTFSIDEPAGVPPTSFDPPLDASIAFFYQNPAVCGEGSAPITFNANVPMTLTP